ncbi:unnamed protein product [Parnassius apollo]|uniref:Deoxyhypusine hydroxylase n=1 Tax=Parnassius apollo TaxID=110799 RepID=A0A8S3XM53_PARAO|nr:unnamed protein product [Parnassius apollo]
MAKVSESAIINIGKVLNDPTRPMKERFRALFTLRNLGGEKSIECISECFKDESVLLKHELAYCLGQMQDKRAIPVLRKVLEDTNQDPIVRHEAGEALGAIGDPNLRELLEKYQNDTAIEVAETCQIALQRLNWIASDRADEGTNLSKSPYTSIDPAPPSCETDVEMLKKTLLDENKPLFERYRAMFSLRNLSSSDSINALGEGLKASSALFRHEVAFVFGQMQDERSIPYLKKTLEDACEHEMVRHEAAEALGSIATDECTEVLKRYLNDPRRVVRESCEVALDMSEYENSPEFQYANTLITMSDLLETERTTFFGLTHEVLLSVSTLEIVEQLHTAVWQHAQGDRKVRRYFESYETPFVGQGRRKMSRNV